jgi:Hypervirulence associated proteins TUDOR domain
MTSYPMVIPGGGVVAGYAAKEFVIDTQPLQETIPMKHTFTVWDHVEWNSEAGHVRGTIKKKASSAITFKGYTVRASKKEPQYLIKSDTTDHLAMHKGSALKKLNSRQ